MIVEFVVRALFISSVSVLQLTTVLHPAQVPEDTCPSPGLFKLPHHLREPIVSLHATSCFAKLVTCRRRRVKCDGQYPVCQMCTRRRQHCERPGSTSERKFVIYEPIVVLEAHNAKVPCRTERLAPSLVEGPTESVRGGRSEPRKDLDVVRLATMRPKAALCDQVIAGLFHHYIQHLAAWYDLCEQDRPFETTVPVRALQVSVLFNAIVAFSAQHKARVNPGYETLSIVYHAACVKELLDGIGDFNPDLREDYLVTACILRSYEILRADSRVEQRHLLGAYQFSSAQDIDMTGTGLLQAGAWNYLREEVTVALECHRPVRLNIEFDVGHAVSRSDSMHANVVTYILARIINHCFAQENSDDNDAHKRNEWFLLDSELRSWKESLPVTYMPYSKAPRDDEQFPSEWYQLPWHVAAIQYFLTAEMLLLLHHPIDNVSDHLIISNASRICGLAYTNENKAARVNAFGPMAFSGKYLKCAKQQESLIRLLQQSGHEIGWPVHRIVDDLQQCWAFA